MVVNLPVFKDENKNFMLMQTKWASILNALLGFAPNQGWILRNITLANGTTQVPHLLGRKLQGWSLVRQRASASIYDTQDANQTPQLTLSLVSSAQVSVDLWVY